MTESPVQGVGPVWPKTAEAAKITGVPERTIRRRHDAYQTELREGLPHTAWAVAGGWTGRQRTFDPVDLQRVRLQRLGRLDGSVVAGQYRPDQDGQAERAG